MDGPLPDAASTQRDRFSRRTFDIKARDRNAEQPDRLLHREEGQSPDVIKRIKQVVLADDTTPGKSRKRPRSFATVDGALHDVAAPRNACASGENVGGSPARCLWPS